MPPRIKIIPARRLTWSEFDSADSLPDRRSAQTQYKHFYQYKRKQSLGRYYPEDIVITVRTIKAEVLKSVQEKATPKQLEELLEHEQGHAHLANLGARGIKRDVESIWTTTPEALEKKIKYTVTIHVNRLETIHELYDEQSKHGTDRGQQVRWNGLIDAALKNTRASTIAGMKF